MSKKIIMACMAVAAFAAFVMPAAASATSPVLTHPTGTAYCPNGGTTANCLVLGTNVGDWVLKSSLGNITCSKVVLTGNITKNKETHIQADVTSATFNGTGVNGDCTAPAPLSNVRVTTTVGNGVPWCLTAGGTLAADEFTARGNSCNLAQRSITFVLDFTEGPTCYYNRTTTVKGTFKTHPEDAVLSFTEQEWTLEKGENETFFKPCLSSGKLTGSATLETDVPGGVNEPMYIS
jgi:hypothetical protein